MPAIILKPFEDIAPAKSGFTIALVDAKAGQHIRIGISVAAQKKHFGGELDPSKDALKMVANSDQGQTHILGIVKAQLGDAGAFELHSGARGSTSVKVALWRPVAKGKRPSKEMRILASRAPASVQVNLPEWARPDPVKIGEGRPLMG